MAVFADFVGGAYQADSLVADAQSCINWFLEGVESGDGQNKRYLRETPGLTLAATLPTSPCRGIWIGQDRIFTVYGAILYEVFSDYTYSALGNVSTDGLPVQIFPNGGQLLVISGGRAWIADGVTIQPALYANRFGDVSIVGTAVTWLDGTKFDATMVAGTIFIDTVPWVVATFVDSTHITLTEAPGDSASSPYSMTLAVTGTATAAGTTTLTWASGMKFDSSMVGNRVTYQGVEYTVATFTDDQHLVMTAIIPAHAAAAFSATVPVFARTGAYLDGVFIVNPDDSKQMNNSAVGNGLLWDLLDFATKQAYPDNISSLLADHEELYVFGTQTTEVWRTNPASSAFTCQRDPGGFMHHGNIAIFSPVRLGEGVAWLGGDPRGWTIAYRATGFQPVRVSTHAIETAWAAYSTTHDAVSYSYIDQGHEFWVINFPTANATWCYDATAGAWQRRGYWNGTTFDRQRQMFHGFCFEKHFVGDWQNGKLYIQSTGVYTDAGDAIMRERAAPHLNREQLWNFYDFFELLTEQGTSATITLQWSDDNGTTWSTGRTSTSTTAGLRYRFLRLGRSRDRIFRIRMSAASKQSIVSAYLGVTQGIG